MTDNCKHDLDLYLKIEDAKLSTAMKPERNIKVRMFYITCKLCDKIFKAKQAGTAEDREMGLILDPEQEHEVHALMTDKLRAELIKGLKLEGLI